MRAFLKTVLIILPIISFSECKKEVPPTVPFLNIKLVTAGGMICYGTISNDGGASIIERGFKWKTEKENDYQNSKKVLDNGTNSFETVITGLSPNTTYYVKAYAANIEGKGYSEEKVITTLRNGTFTDNRDWRTYKWVEMGNQIWMAENLSYIPFVSSFLDDYGIFVYNYIGSSVDEAIKTAEFDTYGCLYSLDISLDVCPDGWHLPSQEEWDELGIFLGKTNQANLLRDTGWGDRYANNLTLFSAQPAGYHFHEYNPYTNLDTYFWYLGNSTFFWSSSIRFDNALAPGLDSYHKEIIYTTYSKEYGLSVRCIKDN
jgi:uncharacterized protein (TIGR02145 family)